ncbi:transporter substrate-binding domain-containing protein [soil metagenome]
MIGSRHVSRALAAALILCLAVSGAHVVAQDEVSEADGHLARILDRGVIRMSTDGRYPPQSELTPDGAYQGFDIDVGTEIAARLGVAIEFTEPGWEVITAGSWGDRWDMSVGSMTITSQREQVIDFTQPYYSTPAQLASLEEYGHDSPDDLAGRTICMGAATTYLEWMGGTLDFGTATPETVAPAGSVAVTRPTDRDCAQEWGIGRRDYQGWLTSKATVDAAIADGLPIVHLGDPVFYEPLAVAFDKGVADNDSLVAAVDAIIGEMHADGTLTELSLKWYGEDLSEQVGE